MLFFVLRAACLPLWQAEQQEMETGRESEKGVEGRGQASRAARRMQIQLPCESNSR